MVNPPQTATNPPEVTGHPPLLNPAALDKLLAELDQDEAALDAFLEAFISHWPERMRRAAASITARDRQAVYDCALSIKVSALMAGALRLSACGGDLENLARSDRLDEAGAAVLDELNTIGKQTIRALDLSRIERSPSPGSPVSYQR